MLTAVRFVGVVGTAAKATFVSADEKSAENARKATSRLIVNFMVSPTIVGSQWSIRASHTPNRLKSMACVLVSLVTPSPIEPATVLLWRKRRGFVSKLTENGEGPRSVDRGPSAR